MSATTASMAAGFADKVAIITGAGSGNGRAIAMALASAGAKAVCADRDGVAAAQTAARIASEGGKALALRMDVTSSADCLATVQEALRAFGNVDILVNNAGVLIRGGVEALTEQAWDQQYAVNVKGAFFMTQAAVPQLRATRGCIVMIASIAGLRGSATHLAYSSSKHALVGMTRCLALELAPDGVRVNAVCPGLVRTPMVEDDAPNFAKRVANYPLGRLGEPEDVASVVLHLASPQAAWTTGLCYALDGGAGLGHA